MGVRVVRLIRRLALGAGGLLAIVTSGAQAQSAASNGLDMVEELSRMAPYIGTPVVESSADVLLQVPSQVDGVAPVPVNVRVLRLGAEWITLLTDADKPHVLARFSLEKGALPQISTRFRSGTAQGVLAVATYPRRILTAERSFSVVPLKGAKVAHDSANANGQPSTDTLALDAINNGTQTVVRLRTADTLVKPVLESDTQPVYIQRFDLLHQGKRVLSAELSADVWYKPFFRFVFTGGKQGDSVVLRWQDSAGTRGELSTTIDMN